MISSEWNLYPGLLGSTPPCRKASTAGRLLLTTRPSASASAKPSCTASRTEISEGFEVFSALMALVRDRIPLDRSAMAASNSAISVKQRAWVSERSDARSSCFFLRSISSVDFVCLDAVSAWMSALSLSMLSWPVVIDVDFVLVVSLQKHANVSYVAASFCPSSSTLVFKSSNKVTTFSTGVTLTSMRRAAEAAANRVRESTALQAGAMATLVGQAEGQGRTVP
mmetsp:Transcript_72438/g.228905  ORF Transcript_72438/g.228905 Transcript_72438/m.228905 type:complete len:224 (-) Transcript_72438:17-688(-)